jgi:hypothetical protein
MKGNQGMWIMKMVALNSPLFTDDQITIQQNEELQRSVFHLNNIYKSYNLNISITPKQSLLKGNIRLK